MTLAQSNGGVRDQEKVLEVWEIRKSFGKVQAIKEVSFSVKKGEIVGLIGDNGAGKSTLIKIIAGVQQADEGEIWLNGQHTDYNSPDEARAAGVETVFQDLALVEIFGVAENIFLGREREYSGFLKPFSFLRQRKMRAEAVEAVKEMGIKVPGIETAMISELSGGQRQGVAIARAAFWRSTLLLLDEPTAALGVAETAEVERLIKNLTKGSDLATLIISHDMPQVARMCDRVVVMRQGYHVATLQGPDIDPTELVGYVTGALGVQEGIKHSDAVRL